MAESVLVTGGAGFVGSHVVDALVAAGRRVTVLDSLHPRTHAAEPAYLNPDATYIRGDVRDPAAVRALVDTAVESSGRLDIMVNNAGLSHPEPIVEADVEGWRAMLETNVLALLVGSQAAVKAMRACGATGHIVNISSVAALRPDSGVYGATKHAVNTICNSLRKELEDDPIQVVNIMPGAIATNFARNFDPSVLEGMVAMTGLDAKPVKGERLPDDVLQAAQAALSDLLATPEDVADAVLYAVTRPPRVHIAELVVRPNKDLNL